MTHTPCTYKCEAWISEIFKLAFKESTAFIASRTCGSLARLLMTISFQLRCCDLIVKVRSAPLAEWSQNIRQLNASLSQGILDARRYFPEVLSFYDAVFFQFLEALNQH